MCIYIKTTIECVHIHCKQFYTNQYRTSKNSCPQILNEDINALSRLKVTEYYLVLLIFGMTLVRFLVQINPLA